MIVFWRLLLAHLLTDFTFQTNGIARWKRESPVGVIVHSGIFLILSFVLCRQWLGQTWWKVPGWAAIVILFIIHSMEDHYRIWSIGKGGSNDNILFFLWDQSIHVVLLFLFSPVNNGNIIEEKVIVALCLLIGVTHFTSILIFYLEEAIYGHEHIFFRLKGKYYLIVERAAIFGCFLLPGRWWLVFAAVLILKPLISRVFTLNDFTRTNLIISPVSAVAFGLLARFILH
ncbi:MAG: DUF3307 domain-containing protein [Elusimicrobia bacterium]|nr:DUF3307 domain-containing protein [Elusimicrobiota bacterium]